MIPIPALGRAKVNLSVAVVVRGGMEMDGVEATGRVGVEENKRFCSQDDGPAEMMRMRLGKVGMARSAGRSDLTGRQNHYVVCR
jgi:hypothetical protein